MPESTGRPLASYALAIAALSQCPMVDGVTLVPNIAEECFGPPDGCRILKIYSKGPTDV